MYSHHIYIDIYIYIYIYISSAARISCDSLAIAHVWVSQHTHTPWTPTALSVCVWCVSQFDKNKVDIFMLRMSLDLLLFFKRGDREAVHALKHSI